MRAKASGPEAGFTGMGGLFATVAIFSAVVNILMLTGSLYMLQVYDRVLASGSTETLLALSILVAGLFAIMGVLDYVRARVAARIGATAQARLDARVFRAMLRRSVHPNERAKPASGLKDLEAVQRFAGSPVLFAIFDMPWAPFFILLIYAFHPWLGHLAVIGMIALIGLTIVNQMMTRKPEGDANLATMQGDAFAETIRQQGELIQALGMRGAVIDRWSALRGRAMRAQLASSDRVGQFSTISKTFRFFLQSAMLGLGAYVVLRGEMSAGAMIAGSILLGRALAPVEQAIGGWPLLLRARSGWDNLKQLLASTPDADTPTALPRPRAFLDVNQITVFPPDQQKASLRMLEFSLKPGQALGVIGQSASGKSTLARVLTGIWRPASGAVRLDGAALDQYDQDTLGRYIGYLPQDVELFAGTVAENIARFDPAATAESVIAAGRAAGVHELILRLPNGYESPIGEGGTLLSAGQRQRVALARALYGDPFFVVLDEPNSNLDGEGEAALTEAIVGVRRRGGIVVVIAHRPSALAGVDLVLVMADGRVQAFGPRDEIMQRLLRPAPIAGGTQPAPAVAPAAQQRAAPAPPAGPLRVIQEGTAA